MGIFDSLKNFVFQTGFEDELVLEEEDDIEPEVAPRNDTRRSFPQGGEARANDTVTLPSRVLLARASEKDQVYTMPPASTPMSANMQIVISQPTDIDGASYICDLLKENKSVIVNMEGIDMKDAQRIMDFLAGVTYSIKGDVQPISSRIYVCSPENVDVSEHFKEQLKANGIFSGLNFKSPFSR